MIIALCRPVYDTVEFDAAECVVEWADQWRKYAPPEHHWVQNSARGQPVDHVRNTLVRVALDTIKADVIVWQDSDVSLPDVRGYTQLVEALEAQPIDVAVLGVPVVQQEARGAPKMNVAMGTLAHQPDPTQPFEAMAIGFGFIAVRASAYQALEQPWHRFEYDSSGNLASGEDIGFCDRVRQLGWRVMVEPRIEARHNFRRSHSLRDVKADQWTALTR